MATNDYSFQEGGVVIIGATTLTNVTNVSESYGGAYQFSDRTVAGDAVASSARGIDPEIEITITIELYDEKGVASDLKSFKKNDGSGKNVTITVHPEGTGSGLPEIVYTGMYLQDKQMDRPAGNNNPPVSGRLVWEGRFATEPSWTTQT